MTTPALFERYPDPASLAEASFDELFPFIKSISYPTTKPTPDCMANMLMDKFHGEVPMTVEELVQLPGVGVKPPMSLPPWSTSSQYGGRHPCISRSSPDRPYRECHDPAGHREAAARIHSARISAKGHHWLILHGRTYVWRVTQNVSNAGETGM